jgi:hypothetical protein
MALDRNEMNERVLDIAQTLLNEGAPPTSRRGPSPRRQGLPSGRSIIFSVIWIRCTAL